MHCLMSCSFPSRIKVTSSNSLFVASYSKLLRDIPIYNWASPSILHVCHFGENVTCASSASLALVLLSKRSCVILYLINYFVYGRSQCALCFYWFGPVGSLQNKNWSLMIVYLYRLLKQHPSRCPSVILWDVIWMSLMICLLKWYWAYFILLRMSIKHLNCFLCLDITFKSSV